MNWWSQIKSICLDAMPDSNTQGKTRRRSCRKDLRLRAIGRSSIGRGSRIVRRSKSGPNYSGKDSRKVFTIDY
jgi:hypothetical protein